MKILSNIKFILASTGKESTYSTVKVKESLKCHLKHQTVITVLLVMAKVTIKLTFSIINLNSICLKIIEN